MNTNPTIRLFLATVLLLPGISFQANAQLEEPDLRDRVDRAIERGLEFLMTQQQDDGSYKGPQGNTTAVPALAGMAFLAKGYVPGEGVYGETINRSIDYILSMADELGYFGKAGNGRLYAHSIATLFLSEVSGMVDAARQTRIEAVLPKATKLLLDAQAVIKNDQHSGGWRYEPSSNDSDMSCSGWALMALRSARLNGGAVPTEAIDAAVAYVKRHHSKESGSFGYQNGTSYGETLTGAGILCLELCGRHNDPDSLRGAQYLMKAYPSLADSGRAFYGMYYTAQGLFQIGGESWQSFADWMYRTWLPRQRPDGAWDRGEEQSPPYQTAMCILAFTVPYRQLPIYQRDETVDEE